MRNDSNNGLGLGPPDYERDLSRLLRQAGDGFSTDAAALTEGGLRRGRTRLWRRRAAVITGATAAVAAIAVAAVQLPSWRDDPPAPMAETPDTDDDGMLRALTELLPADWEVTEGDAEGPESDGEPYAQVTAHVDDVPVNIEVDLFRHTTDDWRTLAGCMDLDPDLTDCEERQLSEDLVASSFTADGSVADAEMIGSGIFESGMSGETGTSGETTGESWHSWHVRLDGPKEWTPRASGMWQVHVSLSTDAPEAQTPDYQPPLDFEQMTALAREPVWQDMLDAATTKHGPPTDYLAESELSQEFSFVAAEDLKETFTGLAPEGLEIADGEDAAPGMASLTVDDGEAPATVTISAYGATGSEEVDVSGDPEEFSGCDVTSLDGATVESCTLPPERADGGWRGSWSVTVVYEDGTALSIEQTTTTDQQEEPTRLDSPLTIDDLTAIATDGAWRDLISGSDDGNG